MTRGRSSIGALLGLAGLAGACSSSAGVAAMPVELVTAEGCGGLRLTLAAGTLYYTNNVAGTVSSVPTAGGAPTVIATAQNRPNAISADATAVYWGNDGDRTVMKAVIPNGTPATFLPAPADMDPLNVANALLASGGTLYVGRGVDTFKVPTAGTVPTAGGAPVQLSHSPDTDMGYPGAFALDATHLYQTELVHSAITRETLDGTQDGLLESGANQALAPDRIAVSRAGLVTDAIAVSGSNVVWANLNGIEIHDKDKTEKQATFASIATSAGDNPITGFVISGDTIYFGESSDNNVESVPLSFTAPSTGPRSGTVIATMQPNPTELAADATNIYYTTLDTTGVCKILKLAK